jgi:hypothetical protein
VLTALAELGEAWPQYRPHSDIGQFLIPQCGGAVEGRPARHIFTVTVVLICAAGRTGGAVSRCCRDDAHLAGSAHARSAFPVDQSSGRVGWGWPRLHFKVVTLCASIRRNRRCRHVAASLSRGDCRCIALRIGVACPLPDITKEIYHIRVISLTATQPDTKPTN